jgi:alkanesulfonate monooxygenase SsuD/methylene tetrahydromethanopterin reductase-like flavin-dependent oxidoreductase (luciferase family)
MAREGRPFMMNVQSDEVTVERMDQYRATMSDAGHNNETVARNVADSWVWRNIFVAETDAEAEKVGIPYFQNMRSYLQTNRDRMNTAAELEAQASRIVGSARNSLEHGIIVGSPETVTERLQKVHGTGVGGVIIHFRLGAMPYDIAANSLKLFAQKVAPNFQD